MKEKFLLVSLAEDKAQKIAQVLANPTARKILDFLAEKDATETEIAKALAIPLSTAHYNLSVLVEGGLITVDEFHYSKKGKEVNHYSLANKYIIIAPKQVSGIRQKLQAILPTLVGVAAISLIVDWLRKVMATSSTLATQAPMEEVGMAMKSMAAPAMDMMVQEPVTTTLPSIAVWFFVGGVITLVLFMIAERWTKR